MYHMKIKSLTFLKENISYTWVYVYKNFRYKFNKNIYLSILISDLYFLHHTNITVTSIKINYGNICWNNMYKVKLNLFKLSNFLKLISCKRVMLKNFYNKKKYVENFRYTF
jgi:hypothetical protein